MRKRELAALLESYRGALSDEPLFQDFVQRRRRERDRLQILHFVEDLLPEIIAKLKDRTNG